MSERKAKENGPVLAICYDFDKTLSPDDMQAQGYIQNVYDGDVSSFWNDCNEMSEKGDMDPNLAYMYKMKLEAEGREIFSRDKLAEYGSKVTLFPGVSEWFERIREYGKKLGVKVEHYIISSGLKEMIEGTSVAKAGAFERIYASSFYYNDRGVAVWPAQVVNYTNKTQFLFRIEKGVLDVNDSGVNEFFAPDEIRIPFRNIVYIGDSDTDVPCMKLVNINGGHSIGVYNNDTLDKTKVYKMLHDNRIRYFAPADYREDSEIDRLVKAIIDRTAANELLENIHYGCENDRRANDSAKYSDDIKRRKLNLILSLNGSESFATTEIIIKALDGFDSWEEDEANMIFGIAQSNTQVRYALSKPAVRKFYCELAEKFPGSEKARAVQELLK